MSTERYVNDVGNILLSITGTDNAARSQSESKLNELIRRDAGDVLLLLAQIGAQGVGGFQLDHRLLALLLLFNSTFQRLMPPPPSPSAHGHSHSHAHHAGPPAGTWTDAGYPSDPFVFLGETVKTRIELVLCSGMTDEQDPRLRKGIGDCVGRWAAGCWRYRRPCPHFPPILLQLTASPLPLFRITPFQVLLFHPTLLSTSVADPVSPESLVQMVSAGLHDPSTDVKVEAIRATEKLLDRGMSSAARDSLGPGLINSVFQCLSGLPPALLHHGFGPMIDLAWNHSALFVPCLPQVLPALVPLLLPPVDLPPHHWSTYQPVPVPCDDWRANAQAAIELLLVFYEWQYKAIVVDEQLRGLETELAGCLLAYECAEAEEDAADDGEDEGLSFPLLSLGRLCDTVDNNRVFEAVLSHASALSRMDDWRARYTAFMGIHAVIPSYPELAQQRIEEILGILEHAAADSDSRVREAFLHAIGELYIARAISERFSDGVLSAVTKLLEDPEEDVRSSALITIQDFYSSSPARSTLDRAAKIVPRLLELYGSGSDTLRSRILLTIPVAAMRDPTTFKPHAEAFFKLLLGVAGDPAVASDLRTSALGTVARLGSIVGRDIFNVCAAQFAELLITNSQHSQRLGVSGISLLQTWVSFCEAIGEGFVPFLPIIMPQLFAAYEQGLVSKGKQANAPATDGLWFTSNVEPADVILSIGRLVSALGPSMKAYITPSLQLSIRSLRFGQTEEATTALRVIVGLLRLARVTHGWQGSPESLADILTGILSFINRKLEYLSQTAGGYHMLAESIAIIGTLPPYDIIQSALQSTGRHLMIIRGLREIRAGEYAEYDDEEKQYADEEQEEERECLEGMKKLAGYLKELNRSALRDSNGGTVDEKRTTFAAALEGALGQIDAEVAAVQAMAGQKGAPSRRPA